tara:strand:+ start:76 stop:195 length:120 start_codon:yes stop_codon:yes gene_type:complete
MRTSKASARSFDSGDCTVDAEVWLPMTRERRERGKVFSI